MTVIVSLAFLYKTFIIKSQEECKIEKKVVPNHWTGILECKNIVGVLLPRQT